MALAPVAIAARRYLHASRFRKDVRPTVHRSRVVGAVPPRDASLTRQTTPARASAPAGASISLASRLRTSAVLAASMVVGVRGRSAMNPALEVSWG
jgi:hypothetical protein